MANGMGSQEKVFLGGTQGTCGNGNDRGFMGKKTIEGFSNCFRT